MAVPYAVLVGILCGAASLIPVVGMKLVYVPVAGYLFVRALVTAPAELVWFPLVFIVVAFVLVDFIPDMILRPYVSGRELHLGTIMLAYILGPLLFGWYGIFLGPMLLIISVHFVRESSRSSSPRHRFDRTVSTRPSRGSHVIRPTRPVWVPTSRRRRLR